MSETAPPVPVPNIYQRMIQVQKAVTQVMKNETVKMFENDKGYKAVTHDDVAAALHLPLAEAGIVLLPEVTSFKSSQFEQKNKYGDMKTWYRTDIEIRVRWINADQPQDFVESNGAAFALDSADKSFAKAYSLALKIVLLKVHLLESRDGEELRPFDQEHPDEKPRGGAKQQRQQQQSSPKKQEQKPEEPPKGKMASSEEIKALIHECDVYGISVEEQKKMLTAKIGRASWKDLSAVEYLRAKEGVDELCKAKEAGMRASDEPPPPAPEDQPQEFPEEDLDAALGKGETELEKKPSAQASKEDLDAVWNLGTKKGMKPKDITDLVLHRLGKMEWAKLTNFELNIVRNAIESKGGAQ